MAVATAATVAIAGSDLGSAGANLKTVRVKRHLQRILNRDAFWVVAGIVVAVSIVALFWLR